jgi:hypothetical protein
VLSGVPLASCVILSVHELNKVCLNECGLKTWKADDDVLLKVNY